MPVIPGEAYVCKDQDLAFCSPSVDLNLMEDNLAMEWLTLSNTLEGWNELITLAEQKFNDAVVENRDKIKILAKGLDELIINKTKSLSFKTPKAKKKGS